ncbi:MAG: DNA-directed RNA polymerase subunit beta', partial [Stellaceae bacterium]
FEPVLIEGKAIQLHPLVCTAFNADFDGDQMAVHVPLSLEAQLEARVLMMSTNNILSPASGKPIIVPSQDIVLGLYHMTMERDEHPGMALRIHGIDELKRALAGGSVFFYAPAETQAQILGERQALDYEGLMDRIARGEVTAHRKIALPNREALEARLARGELRVFDAEHAAPATDLSPAEIETAVAEGRAFLYRVPTFHNDAEVEEALQEGVITLQSKIRTRLGPADGRTAPPLVETTPGRLVLSEILPEHPNLGFDLINQLLTKKEISNVIDQVYRHCGQKETVIFCDRLMTLGFQQACKAGISFGKDDLIIPDAKRRLIAEAQEKVKEYEQQYQEGLITQGEKYNKVVDVWSACTEKVADEMLKMIRASKPGEPINSVWMMADSGARGSAAQIKQLAGMRGLMAKPSGEIIETPIISNFKEGLTVLEYFNSTHGARKGLADTALKTANSGYLTRRLVDVAQDAIITEEDCGTTRGLPTRAVVESGEVIAPLAERILGRTAAVDLIDPLSGAVAVAGGTLIDEEVVARIEEAGIDEVMIRSVLTCETSVGLCAKCYGRDLARGTLVNIGEAVGVIAAQSIGEPGTQLTMRTFHIGGAAQRGAEQSSIEAAFDATVQIANRNVVLTSKGVPIVMGRNCEIVLLDDAGREKARHRVPYGAQLLADEGSRVAQGERLVEWDPHTIPIITERGGIAHYVDLITGVSMREEVDEATGISYVHVTDWKQQQRGSDLRPRITLRDEAGEVVTLTNGMEARYFLPERAILSIENGARVEAGDVIARLPRESYKTRDITGGLPRVAELFEARRPKDFAIISEGAGRIVFGKDYKTKRRIVVVPNDDGGEGKGSEYLIPKGKHIAVQEGDLVQKGDLLMDGNRVPHDILRILGVEALANYLIHEIQEVYR